MLAAQGLTIANGGQITSATLASGNGGPVTVAAGSLIIDGQGYGLFTGISVDALLGSGNAGSVTVSAGSLIIEGGPRWRRDVSTYGGQREMQARCG